MFRALTLSLISLATIVAQTPGPIEVTGSVSPIDTHKWVGFQEGPGLYMAVKNTSGRAVSGIVFETIFTDTASGARLPGRHEHTTYKSPENGILIAPNASMSEPKPYPLPVTPSGSAANYSFTVDLVVFEDGSTWGPAKTRAATQLLRRIGRTQP
jgi:hypothetical protein